MITRCLFKPRKKDNVRIFDTFHSGITLPGSIVEPKAISAAALTEKPIS